MSAHKKNNDYVRTDRVHVDETAVIARLYAAADNASGVMVDVGAHYGGAAFPFHELGWSVYCFEPDTENRRRLTERFAGFGRVVIDARAVGAASQQQAPFYRSRQSTGISGLSAFHKTHKKAGVVDVTTLAEIARSYDIGRIDFLKIDVEGHDLGVLQGAPWETVRPRIVECEFEDAKTRPLGHTWRDIANFLERKNYTVYVSEWHPIIQYGVQHEWRRLFRYDEQTEIAEGAWGNFLAFENDPGEHQLRAAFEAVLVKRSAKQSSEDGQGALRRPFYAPFGDWLRARAPYAYRVMKRLRIIMSALWKRRIVVAGAMVVLALLLSAGAAAPTPILRTVIWSGAALLALGLPILGGGLWAYDRIRELSVETAELRSAIALLKDKILNARHTDDIVARIQKLETHNADHSETAQIQKRRIEMLIDLVAEMDEEQQGRELSRMTAWSQQSESKR